jgi:hypothetical protein
MKGTRKEHQNESQLNTRVSQFPSLCQRWIRYGAWIMKFFYWPTK